jgi:hypothetical protein
MSNFLHKANISSGFRQIKDGRWFDRFFARPEEQDRIIIKDGEVEETVDLMKKVVWKYLDDTKEIARYLKRNTLYSTCQSIWDFLFNHIQYKLDQKGLEQLRRPNRSWADRTTGIDCDCFSIFVSSILTNLKIPHEFRITKYNKEAYQHVYVIVPSNGKSDYITIDCVLSQFNYEKPFTAKKDFSMSLNGINVAVLSGAESDNVMDLVAGLDDLELLGADNEAQRLQSIYEHLVKTRNMIAEKPSLISNVDYPPAFLKMLDYAIENWNTPNRDKALEILAKNEDALNRLNGFDGDDDDELDGLDDYFMGDDFDPENLGKAAAKKKGFFKKVGQAIKKGGKLLIRFNPITISARAGFLLAMKLNVKKMASKIKWAYATKEEAAKKGISAQDWEKSKKTLDKIEKLFVDKLQGKKSALRNAVLKGKAGGLNGVEDDSFDGLAFAPAAALAAAIPVITSALKIMVDNGVMKKGEADNIQAEVNSKASEADKLANDPDIVDSGTEETASATSATSSSQENVTTQGGIVGFIKQKPLIVIGGAALGIWGLSKLLGGNKNKVGNSLGGTPGRKGKTYRKKKSGKRKVSAITLK